MIKNLIFDFGDVFINLDKQGAWDHALDLFKIDAFSDDMIHTNEQYEQGFITTDEFINFYKSKFPNLDRSLLIHAWNYIIKDFPSFRLDWLKNLESQKQYKLILLSNTNALHIKFIKENVSFYEEFKSKFNAFYLSHEIGLRKPNPNIYEYVLKENNLLPNECLFIDDTEENTLAASKLGIHTWNIDENNQDVIDLFTINKSLF